MKLLTVQAPILKKYFFIHRFFRLILYILYLSLGLLNACAPKPFNPSPGHINTSLLPQPKDNIPPLIQQFPFLPEPQSQSQPQSKLETFTVVVDNVPIDKLLFTLARDAGLNIDIYPGITGYVTLNAINQTLPQLLERIAKQVDLRYQIDGTHIIISQDKPYMHIYKVAYVNMMRDTLSEVTIATQIISDVSHTASGDNNSTTKIINKSNHRFWENIEKNVRAILSGSRVHKKNQIIINPESGVINVRATHKQHKQIQHFLDQVVANVQRQVLIEATIVEVQLSDKYQAGVDWQLIAGDFKFSQLLTGGNLKNAPFYSFGYSNPNSLFGNLSTKVRLLEQFGKVKVLSSPKVLALNNQTAVIKIVDNRVYFTVRAVPSTQMNLRGDMMTTFSYSTTPQILPVGLIMNVTPQISEYDVVTLNIRPTISRIIGFKKDPNPDLAKAGVVSQIPEVQVREMESILKINNGDVAIIGGLMQDASNQKTQGVPMLSRLPVVGDLFSYRNDKYTKTELVIFLRPVVVKEASLSGDLRDYKVYLPQQSQP